MIGLTENQKQRLMNAASNLRMDERSALSLGATQVIADRINQVLYELHMENPAAFVTNAAPSLGGMEFTPNYAMVKRRKFYDQPNPPAVRSSDYATYVKPVKERL
jgi:hypothetical protein